MATEQIVVSQTSPGSLVAVATKLVVGSAVNHNVKLLCGLDCFQLGTESQGVNLLQQCIDGLSWTEEAVMSIQQEQPAEPE